MKPPLAVDTSVAIPLLVRTHTAHAAVVAWWAHREAALCGHALAETYSVLTRLPRDLRLAPMDAARLLTERFAAPLLLSSRTTEHLPRVLAHLRSLVARSMTLSWPLPPPSTGLNSPHAMLEPRTLTKRSASTSLSPRESSADSTTPTAVRSRSPPTCPRPATGHVVQRALPQQRLRAFFVGHVAQGRRRTDPQR